MQVALQLVLKRALLWERMGLPWWVSGKESACQFRRCGPESRGPPGEGSGNPLQYSSLGTPMDRGACGAI